MKYYVPCFYCNDTWHPVTTDFRYDLHNSIEAAELVREKFLSAIREEYDRLVSLGYDDCPTKEYTDDYHMLMKTTVVRKIDFSEG